MDSLLSKPEKCKVSWMSVNYSKLPLKSDLKPIPPDKDLIYYQCYHTLEEAGYIAVDEVNDMQWVKTAAYLKDPSLPLFDKDFASAISSYIDEAALIDLEKRSKPYLEHRQKLPFEGDKFKLSPATLVKWKKKYARKYCLSIAKELKDKVVAPCELCGDNESNGMKASRCCGENVHEPCFAKWDKKNCPNCNKALVLSNKIAELEKALITKEEYAKRKKFYAEAKKKKEAELDAETQKVLDTVDVSKLMDALEKRKVVKKKKQKGALSKRILQQFL
eukprot:TRINITY_DN1623_c1_g1_i1.p2 TRINITY_DN1623_c1_g1~~TRINITY_DN1623_c1_g1_i1.p2  ORF type:complete len:276 (-),score=39.22 TRINITY_DN1623_c1_g1_i1:338-1165(-)